MAFVCSRSSFFFTQHARTLSRLDQAVKWQQSEAVDFAKALKSVSTAKDWCMH